MTPTPDILGSPLFSLLSRLTVSTIVVEPSPGDGDGEPVKESVPGERSHEVIDLLAMTKKILGVRP